MCLLKKDTSFIWDDEAQKYFEDLKHDLTHLPLLQPPNYMKDYILYLVASSTSISMVLVQEVDDDQEHVVYYLSKSLSGPEIHYSHVEKLALVIVQAVQHFRNYILLWKTTIIFDCNPMQHILTKHVLGGKYSKWIVILQENDLDFEKAKSKKSLVFAELIFLLPSPNTQSVVEYLIPDENLFLIDTLDLWYGDIIHYLQTQTFLSELSSSDCRCTRYHT